MNLMKQKLDSALSQLEMGPAQKTAILAKAAEPPRRARGRRTAILALALACLLGVGAVAATLRGGVTSSKDYGYITWEDYRQGEIEKWAPEFLPDELTQTTPPDWWGDAEVARQKVEVVLTPQPWEPTSKQLAAAANRYSTEARIQDNRGEDMPVVEYTLPDLEAVKDELGLAYLTSDVLELYQEVTMEVSTSDDQDKDFVISSRYSLRYPEDGSLLAVTTYSCMDGTPTISGALEAGTAYKSNQWISEQLEVEVTAWYTLGESYDGQPLWRVGMYFTRDNIAYIIRTAAFQSEYPNPVEYAKMLLDTLYPIA